MLTLDGSPCRSFHVTREDVFRFIPRFSGSGLVDRDGSRELRFARTSPSRGPQAIALKHESENNLVQIHPSLGTLRRSQ